MKTKQKEVTSDSSITPATTTRNKKAVALKALGLWNNDPEQTTSRQKVIQEARAIRESSCERKK
ncbi:hypothetical protein [Tunicatimonas pelagia]|uniref:hypothetical protein n=1 Tax=Tunicatimonas pelagia TaxID=931531 RepID=UPI002667158A|nr:hypothetical protein [Tunicatimonas pelagia]WKN42092.1 hypothetical protein P0M28_23935 [Tunicatimonas pelagia]